MASNEPQSATAGSRVKSFVKIVSQWLATMTPKRRPRLWIAINSLALIASILLLGITIYTDDDSRAVELADQYYLVYNFGTTIIWCLESALSAFAVVVPNSNNRRIESGTSETNESAAPDDKKKRFQSLLVIAQFALAFYFVGESIVLLWRWKWEQEDIGIIFSVVVLNCVAYSIALASTVKLYCRDQQQRESLMNNSNTSLNHDLVENETTLLLA